MVREREERSNCALVKPRDIIPPPRSGIIEMINRRRAIERCPLARPRSLTVDNRVTREHHRDGIPDVWTYVRGGGKGRRTTYTHTHIYIYLPGVV